MTFFYKIHGNSKVGYKKLTDADLGIRGGSSHQTHIGLHETSLDYLKNFRRNFISPFIYEDKSKELLCLLTFIERSNGRIEAPKIISGKNTNLFYEGVKINSVTKEIREITQKEGIDLGWYLMWFGLENEDLVFFLFKNDSEDFKEVIRIIGNVKIRGTINKNDVEFKQIINFLELKINKTSIAYLEELEIIAQTNDVASKIIKPRSYDIEKAKAFYQETGKKGEELVAIYLEKLKASQSIKNYKWMNQSKESGFPYDFEIDEITNKKIFTDVKTTSYTFQQKMIFSNQELMFINQNPNYHVFRVYNINEEIPVMRVCENIDLLSQKIMLNISSFEKDLLLNETSIKELKLAISPINRTLIFNQAISLK